jgi:hypothetical protein
MCREGHVERLLPGRVNLDGTVVVHRRRREHAQARVIMLVVVPVEERFTKSVRVLLRAEPIGKRRPVLQRLELAF